MQPEYFNPAGLVKDRITKAMIDDAVQFENTLCLPLLREGSTTVEQLLLPEFFSTKMCQVLLTKSSGNSIKRLRGILRVTFIFTVPNTNNDTITAQAGRGLQDPLQEVLLREYF